MQASPLLLKEILTSFRVKCCLNISIPEGLHVLNTVTFNSFILPGVYETKLFFASALLRVWCLRPAWAKAAWKHTFCTQQAHPMAPKYQKVHFCLLGPLAQFGPLPSKPAACGLTLPFWPLYVHGFSCYFLTGIGLFYDYGGNIVYFASSKAIFMCSKA